MPRRLLAISDRIYTCLLQAYPRAFRDRFAAEMVQVFRCLCWEAYAESGAWGVIRLWLPALWDGAQGALHQWWLYLFQRRMGNMQTDPIDVKDGIQPLSPLQAGIAALPFLVFGVSSLVSRLEVFHAIDPSDLHLWQVLLVDPFLVFNWLVLIGLGICLFAGFPRWGYAYLGWALLFAWWWSGMGFYGFTIGWKIWLPLLAALLIPLAVRRSWQPLRALFAGLWRDWTLLSLGLYILYGFVFMIYDENHHPYLLAFIATTAVALSAGAWGYFRSITPIRRILALMGGLLVATILSVINNATWDYRAYYGLPESAQKVNPGGVIAAAALVLLMLGNALLARWWLKHNSHLKET
jgi:hypothetical protein